MRPLVIEKVEPTPLFPKVNRGLLLRQQAVLRLNNFGPRRDVLARITAGAAAAYLEDLGEVAPGASSKPITITDMTPCCFRLPEISPWHSIHLPAKIRAWNPKWAYDENLPYPRNSRIYLRFHETQGKPTAVTVWLPFLERTTSAGETNLMEVDRPVG